MSDKDTPISQLSGPELLDYLNILSQRQSEFSKEKIKLTEAMKPIEQERATLRLSRDMIVEKMKQTKIEIAGVKYALKAEKD